jgi:hypothetical protein
MTITIHELIITVCAKVDREAFDRCDSPIPEQVSPNDFGQADSQQCGRPFQ